MFPPILLVWNSIILPESPYWDFRTKHFPDGLATNVNPMTQKKDVDHAAWEDVGANSCCKSDQSVLSFFPPH